MTRFTEITLADFAIGDDDYADILVTVVSRHGCDYVQSVDFASRHRFDITGPECAAVIRWCDDHPTEFADLIEAARERDREEVA